MTRKPDLSRRGMVSPYRGGWLNLVPWILFPKILRNLPRYLPSPSLSPHQTIPGIYEVLIHMYYVYYTVNIYHFRPLSEHLRCLYIKKSTKHSSIFKKPCLTICFLNNNVHYDTKVRYQNKIITIVTFEWWD